MAFALVASTSKASVAGAAVTSNAIDTTGANLLLAIVGWFDNGSGAAVIADSKTNSWTGLTTRAVAGQLSERIFYSVPSSVGSGHTVSQTASGLYSGLVVFAFSGAHATPFDQQAGATGTATSLATGSLTPPEDNCLVIAGLGNENNSAGAVSINGGFTALTSAYSGGNSEGAGGAYLIQTTAAAANPTWTITNSAQIAVALATFKAAAAVGGSANPWYAYAQC